MFVSTVISDIEPTSLTEACFNLTFSKRACGLRHYCPLKNGQG